MEFNFHIGKLTWLELLRGHILYVCDESCNILMEDPEASVIMHGTLIIILRAAASTSRLLFYPCCPPNSCSLSQPPPHICCACSTPQQSFQQTFICIICPESSACVLALQPPTTTTIPTPPVCFLSLHPAFHRSLSVCLPLSALSIPLVLRGWLPVIQDLWVCVL